MSETHGGDDANRPPLPPIFYPIYQAEVEQPFGPAAIDYEPKIHEHGWNMVIEARNGFVSLQNSGSQLYLSYSGDPVPAEVIKSTLEVDNDDMSIGLLNYAGTHTEEELYYSDPLPEGGRVHILANTSPLPGQWPQFIDSNGEMKAVSETGGKLKNNIATDPFSFYYLASNAANADPEVIQRYRDKFILLAAMVAANLGGALAITTQFKNAGVAPSNLDNLGYETQWHKMNPRLLRRGSNLAVKALKDEVTVILLPDNSRQSWASTRKLVVDESIIDATSLAKSIRCEHLYY